MPSVSVNIGIGQETIWARRGRLEQRRKLESPSQVKNSAEYEPIPLIKVRSRELVGRKLLLRGDCKSASAVGSDRKAAPDERARLSPKLDAIESTT